MFFTFNGFAYQGSTTNFLPHDIFYGGPFWIGQYDDGVSFTIVTPTRIEATVTHAGTSFDTVIAGTGLAVGPSNGLFEGTVSGITLAQDGFAVGEITDIAWLANSYRENLNDAANGNRTDLNDLLSQDHATFDVSGAVYAVQLTGDAFQSGVTFLGSPQGDVAVGSPEDDTLRGNDGEDFLHGLDGDDFVEGGAGNDYLHGGLGADTIDGGDGIDVVDYSEETVAVQIDLRPGGENGGAASDDILSNIENVEGTDAADVIQGNSGNNDIRGRGGADSLYGHEGNDVLGVQTAPAALLDGGDGDDLLIVALETPGDITVIGGPGMDTVYFLGDSPSPVIADLQGDGPASAANAFVLNDFTGVEIFRGTDFNDQFSGDASTNRFYGETGHDLLRGRGGDDFLFGDDGNDTLDGGAGADALFGGDGMDTADYASATGRVLADLQIDQSGAGFTRFFDEGAAAGDRFHGIENLTGGAFADNLRGDAGANLLMGGGVSDRLYGRDGDDVLMGGTGADALYGNLGADVMTGGSDAGRTDRYIYFSALESAPGAGNRDIVTDFTPGEDRLELGRIDADTTAALSQHFTFIGDAGFSGTPGELGYRQDGGATIVQADTSGDAIADFEIELGGTIDLTASDFLL